MKYFILELIGWIKYFFTKKKYNIILSDEVKEYLRSLSPEEQNKINKVINTLSKNPKIGRPVNK